MVALNNQTNLPPLTDAAQPMPHQLTAEDDPLAGHKIREARERLGLSRRKLGELLDPPTPGRTVAHWEADDYRPKSPRREALADILGIQLGPDPGPESGIRKEDLVKTLLAIRTMVDELIARA